MIKFPSRHDFFRKEKFSKLPSKNKVADENLHFHSHTSFLVKLQCFIFSGPQLNVDSDDEDTPFEDSDNDDSHSDEDTIDSDNNLNPSDAEVPFFVRQPSPIPRNSNFVSEKDRNARFVVADFVCSESRFSKVPFTYYVSTCISQNLI